MLPLFPLGSVLFPGMPLPLHIFEERYRQLMRDLLDAPAPRQFGVVSIELGHEVGTGAARRLADVGCTAEIQDIDTLPDGRLALLAIGGKRFQVASVSSSERPYLTATVDPLPDTLGDLAPSLIGRVGSLFRRYLARLAEAHPGRADALRSLVSGDLPDDATELSYLVASGLLIDRADKQHLLAAPTVASRLEREVTLLDGELRLFASMPSVPVADQVNKGVSPN